MQGGLDVANSVGQVTYLIFCEQIVGSSCFPIHKKPPTRFEVYLEELVGHFWHFWKIKRLHMQAFCFLKCLYIYIYIYSHHGTIFIFNFNFYAI
jgi:hypothetical protein